MEPVLGFLNYIVFLRNNDEALVGKFVFLITPTTYETCLKILLKLFLIKKIIIICKIWIIRLLKPQISFKRITILRLPIPMNIRCFPLLQLAHELPLVFLLIQCLIHFVGPKHLNAK